MTTTAKDILDEARSTYLNDVNATEATDAILLSHLKTAVRNLHTTLESNGMQCINEETTKIIPANTDEWAPLPPDLVIPSEMFDRQANSNDEWRPINFKYNIPVVSQGPFLNYWTYRLDRILFLAATQDREAKLIYFKSWPLPTTPDANIIGRSEEYLTAKTCAYYFMFVRQNPSLAKTCEDIAQGHLDDLINKQVKLMQSAPVRRKGYMPYRNS